MDAAELTIVLAIVLPGAAAVLGWYLGSRRAQQGRPIVRPSPAWRRAVTGVIVVGAVSARCSSPPVIAVFWALVACNFAFGRGENLPFSTYPMFSQPAEHAWSLRVEDAAGVVIPIAMLGVDPVVARKRFATDEHAAMERRGRRSRRSTAGRRRGVRRTARAAPSAPRPARQCTDHDQPDRVRRGRRRGESCPYAALRDDAGVNVEIPSWTDTAFDVMRVGLGYVVLLTAAKTQFFRPSGAPSQPIGIARGIDLSWMSAPAAARWIRYGVYVATLCFVANVLVPYALLYLSLALLLDTTFRNRSDR